MPTLKFLAAFVCILFCVTCEHENTFTDTRDGKTYKTVKIGEQTWLAENLSYKAKGSKCYYSEGYYDTTANCKKYGRLYNWATAMKACPSGWHLPDSLEWEVLIAAAGGDTIAGKYLKSTSGWNDYREKSGNGKDKFGFSAMPGGYGKSSRYDYFNRAGNYGDWWGASDDDRNRGYISRMGYYYDNVYYYYYDKKYLRSVRCIQGASTQAEKIPDEPIEPKTQTEETTKPTNISATFVLQKGTFTDARDGKVYKTTKIGEQVWLAENLNYNAKGSKCYNDSTAYCDKYGRLYDWVTAMDIDEKYIYEEWGGNDVKHKGICPTGWHLPNKKEWDILDIAVGGEETADKYLKAKSGWRSDRGEDKFGFSALPGGAGGSGGGFGDVGARGNWWSSTSDGLAYQRLIFHWYDNAHYYGNSKYHLFSVRCVQD